MGNKIENFLSPASKGRRKISLISRLLRLALVIGLSVPSLSHSYIYEDNESTGVFYTDLKIENQSGWAPYVYENIFDTFRGTIEPSQQSISVTVPLSKTIQPGRVHVFVKGYAEEVQLKVKALLGNGLSTDVDIDNNDDNKHWTDALVVDVLAPSNQLQLTISKRLNYTAPVAYVLRGVYVTETLTEYINENDGIIDPAAKEELVNSAVVPGNNLSNSSFEVPPDAGWGHKVESQLEHSLLRTDEEAYHGSHSLVVGIPWTHAVSRAYHLKAGKTYTFSAYVKTDPGKSLEGDLIVKNTYDPPGDANKPYTFTKSFVANDQWQRVSVTGMATPSPGSSFYLFVNYRHGTGKLYADALQLEEGTLTAYKPGSPLDMGVTFDPVGHIFYNTDSIQANLHLANYETTSADDQISYSVYNFYNQLVKTGTLQSIWSPRQTIVKKIPIDPGENGYFRLVVHGKKDRWAECERAFSVIYPISNTAFDTESVMGIHAEVTPYHLSIMNRLGIRWLRSMSVDPLFRWSDVEKTNNAWAWQDAKVDLVRSFGIIIMGTFYSPPSWAMNGSDPDLTAWTDYIRTTVLRYKSGNKVMNWEIGNEPIQEAGYSYTHYAKMLKTATDAINAIDPNINIIGMGGFPYASYFIGIIDEVERLYPTWNWKNDIDVHSAHIYHMNTYGNQYVYQDVIVPEGVTVWNTETGSWSGDAYHGEATGEFQNVKTLSLNPSAYQYYDALIDSPRQLVRNFIDTLGFGQKKYFYYDMRDHTAPDYNKTHSTILEYDGHIRPTGVAYAIAGHFLDHSQRKDSMHIKGNWLTHANFFEKNGKVILGLIRKDNLNQSLSINLPKGSYRIYNIMGNQIGTTGDLIPFGPEPMYVVAEGLTFSELKTAVQNAQIHPPIDNREPTVVITHAPTDKVDENFFSVEWLGMDDLSMPTVQIPNAITYSYRLLNYDNTWTTWNPYTYIAYNDVPKGSYRFDVKARDEAGKESVVASRWIEVYDVFNTGGPLPNPGQNPVVPPTGFDPPPAGNDPPSTDSTVLFSGNPFNTFKNYFDARNEKLKISLVIPVSQIISLGVYDREGNKVIDVPLPTLEWDGTKEGSIVSAGTYFLKLKTSSETYSKAIVVLK